MTGNKDAGNDQAGDNFRSFLELKGEQVKADRYGDKNLRDEKGRHSKFYMPNYDG